MLKDRTCILKFLTVKGDTVWPFNLHLYCS
jgi:hypothetical protein